MSYSIFELLKSIISKGSFSRQKQHKWWGYRNIHIYLIQLPYISSQKNTKVSNFCSPLKNSVAWSWRMTLESEKMVSDGKAWNLCRMPFWQTSHASSSSSSSSSSAYASASASASSTSSMHYAHHQRSINLQSSDRLAQHQSSSSVSSMAKSLLPTRKRLHLDPPNKLYFPCKFLMIPLCLPFENYLLLRVFVELCSFATMNGNNNVLYCWLSLTLI